MTECPPRERLEGLLEEVLEEAERESLSAHVDGCPTCQEALERLTEAPASIRGTLAAGNSAAGLSAQLLSRLALAPEASTTPEPRGELPAVAGYQILEELGRG